MRQPNVRIGQTVITLSSLVVALLKLIHVIDHHVTRWRFAECVEDSLSDTKEIQKCLHKLGNDDIGVIRLGSN